MALTLNAALHSRCSRYTLVYLTIALDPVQFPGRQALTACSHISRVLAYCMTMAAVLF